jgi:hypothetical protein
MTDPRLPSPVITRYVDGLVCAYTPALGELGVLAPAMAWKPSPGDEVLDHTAAPDLQRAYYTTLNAVVCLSADGSEAWRYGLVPESTQRHGHRPGCLLSPDGRALWVYRPDAMAGRGRGDHWEVLDAGTGVLVAEAALETVGHGGLFAVHPATGEVLLDVGEGQDGSVIFRGTLTGTGVVLHQYPWADRCLIGLSPNGHQFLTVDHGQADVALHAYPDGEVTFRLTVEDFGHDPEEDFVEWSGGYLDADTVIAVLGGETEDGEEWFRYYRVDTPTGRVLGEFDAHENGPYDIQPLGDGTWLTTDSSGHPIRWAQA